MSIALPKQKHLGGSLLSYLKIAEDNGDLSVWRKACEIGREMFLGDLSDNAKPLIVIYKDGSPKILNTRANVISACRIGDETLRKCLETGEQDRLGRCYDYTILEQQTAIADRIFWFNGLFVMNFKITSLEGE